MNKRWSVVPCDGVVRIAGVRFFGDRSPAQFLVTGLAAHDWPFTSYADLEWRDKETREVWHRDDF